MNNRLERLNARRIDSDVLTATRLNEVYKSISQSEAVKYVIGAMQPIDPEYTKNTFAQGERVRKQLAEGLTTGCEYEYQGSVTNDTHIKAKSDIDILLIIGKYYALEAPQVATNPYKGDPIQDLLDLREESRKCLERAYPQAIVDTSSNKCIRISGGSLTREIDIVPSNWFDTNDYTETKNKTFRGVEILNAKEKIRIKNTPFLHNAWIADKDSKTQGGLRKAARLMKSLMYDTESIELSSYDIVSIAYNMDVAQLTISQGEELKLLQSCIDFCTLIDNNSMIRDSLNVPDQHRKVFAQGHATQKGLKQLLTELIRLSDDILRENSRSFKKLAEARVIYP